MKINMRFVDGGLPRSLSEVTITSAVLLFATCAFAQSVWQEQTTGLEETRYLTKVAFGAGRFVGVGGITNGVVLISPNGHSWTPTAISNTNLLRGVAFVGGMFLAVGDGGALMSSSDGLSWASRNSGVTESLNAVTYGNGLFVAVGNNGAVTKSSNGESWMVGASLTNSYKGISFGDGMFVSVGSVVGSTNSCGEGTVISSSDGVSWTNHAIHSGALPLEVAFANGQFVTAGEDIWSVVSIPGVGDVCIGGFRTVLISSNGVDWLTVTNGPNWQQSICYGYGNYVSVGSSDINSSEDGLVWRQRHYANGLYLSGVAFGNNRFVAVGGGKVMVAPVDFFLSEPLLNSSGRMQFRLNGGAGQLYTIEASSDLLTWEPLLTIAGQNEPLLLADPKANLHQSRFYRMRLED